MSKYHVVVAHCDRYEIEAENDHAALTQVREAHYKGHLKRSFEDQRIDFFTEFKSEGEVLGDGDESETIATEL